MTNLARSSLAFVLAALAGATKSCTPANIFISAPDRTDDDQVMSLITPSHGASLSGMLNIVMMRILGGFRLVHLTVPVKSLHRSREITELRINNLSGGPPQRAIVRIVREGIESNAQ
jgi:hypothetical protein